MTICYPHLGHRFQKQWTQANRISRIIQQLTNLLSFTLAKEGLHTTYSKDKIFGFKWVRKMQVETGFCTNRSLTYSSFWVGRSQFDHTWGSSLTGLVPVQWEQ